MTSSQSPIGGGPRDPFDRAFRPEPVDEEARARYEKQKELEDLAKKENLGIAAFLLQLFSKMAQVFARGFFAAKGDTVDARENLRLFKMALDVLKEEDRSQDTEFLKSLSHLWQRALEDALHFASDAAKVKFKVLVKRFQNYPEGQPHSFAYYLQENTASDWIPFPFMQLIQKIHSDHLKNPDLSPLSDWTRLLDEIAFHLKPD